ncbi:MAG TPA: FAD-binding protein [Steroidobacteraceae bacterium]|nr:FAD-binding protein [Steroidobacteraceae bacterium]
MSESHGHSDIEADVVVLGTGGAALTAALSAHDHGAGTVVILERSGMVGGTTAMSGGMLWIPMNHHEQEFGIADSWDDVVMYLDALSPGLLDPDTLEAFLVAGPEMIRYFADKTPVRLHVYPNFPDYQPNVAGALPRGTRSLDNHVFPFDQLGSWAVRVNPPKTGLPTLFSMVEAMYGGVDDATLAERRRRDCRGRGQALIGSLLRGVLDRNIRIHLETRGVRLCRHGSRVIGVVAEQQKSEIRARARKGVIVATGGFEWNERLAKAFVRGPITGPVSVPESDGDGLMMAMGAGARLANMSNAWWMMSTLQAIERTRDAQPNYLLCQAERTLPGSILVNRSARRFVNEAVNYNALGPVLHNFDANSHDYPNMPYWLVFDGRFKNKYPVFTSPPKDAAPSWAARADSIEALAERIGLDGRALRDTVDRFNADVRKGHDDEFQRGDTTFDNFWGDQSFEPPFCTLGVIDQPPFYAIKMEAGVLGTAGGPKTNANGQVVDWSDQPIEGLYAAGNTMAQVTAMGYGGAGGTLGPGMTFGFIAGRHAATQSPS